MKILIQKMLRKIGIQMKRYPDLDLARRIKIMENFNIDALLDIGANIGQYAIRIQ